MVCGCARVGDCICVYERIKQIPSDYSDLAVILYKRLHERRKSPRQEFPPQDVVTPDKDNKERACVDSEAPSAAELDPFKTRNNRERAVSSTETTASSTSPTSPTKLRMARPRAAKPKPYPRPPESPEDTRDLETVMREESNGIADRIASRRAEAMPSEAIQDPLDVRITKMRHRALEKARLEGGVSEMAELEAKLSVPRARIREDLHTENQIWIAAEEHRGWLDEARLVLRTLESSKAKILRSAFLGGYMEHSLESVDVDSRQTETLTNSIAEADEAVTSRTDGMAATTGEMLPQQPRPFVEEEMLLAEVMPEEKVGPQGKSSKKVTKGSGAHSWEAYLSQVAKQTEASNVLTALAKAYQVRQNLAKLRREDRMERARASRTPEKVVVTSTRDTTDRAEPEVSSPTASPAPTKEGKHVRFAMAEAEAASTMRTERDAMLEAKRHETKRSATTVMDKEEDTIDDNANRPTQRATSMAQDEEEGDQMDETPKQAASAGEANEGEAQCVPVSSSNSPIKPMDPVSH